MPFATSTTNKLFTESIITIIFSVKLGNLLIDDELNIKLADFGLATKIEFIGDRKHTICGTPNYIAPEVIRASLGKGASGHSY